MCVVALRRHRRRMSNSEGASTVDWDAGVLGLHQSLGEKSDAERHVAARMTAVYNSWVADRIHVRNENFK